MQASYQILDVEIENLCVFLSFSVTDFKSDVTVPVEDNADELGGQESRYIDGYSKIESKIFVDSNVHSSLEFPQPLLSLLLLF